MAFGGFITDYVRGLFNKQNATDARAYLGITGGGGGIPEAPIDGSLYGRENATWVVVPAGGGVPEAPNDGNLYGRKSLGWSLVPGVAFGDLTENVSNILTIGGGTGAVHGSGTTIQVSQASGSTNGFLSSTDWTTFNSKQAAGSYLTDAPSDGSTYGRLNGGWSAVSSGIPDAASDGNLYARKNGAWSVVTNASGLTNVLQTQVFS